MRFGFSASLNALFLQKKLINAKIAPLNGLCSGRYMNVYNAKGFFFRFCPRWSLNFFFLLFNCKNHSHSHEWSCRIELRVEILTKANFSFAYFFMMIIRPAFDFDFSLFRLFWALDILFNSFLSLDSLHKLIGILTVWLVEQVPSWFVVTSAYHNHRLCKSGCHSWNLNNWTVKIVW